MTEKVKTDNANVIATGLAMFSMFFGAGNVVFPLALGQYAQDKNIYAILGLLISAVGVPFLGLIAMILFNGNYKHFFEQIGKVPGFLLSLAIMGLIGPFGAIPRCITLSYATVKIFMPNLSLIFFSITSCILIFLLTVKRTKILDILGYVLTPILLGSLAILIVKGILLSPSTPVSGHDSTAIFIKGLHDGYQTMDLLGAFFFSSVILACLERNVASSDGKRNASMIHLALKASAVGALLLSLTYVGFSFTAAFHSSALQGYGTDQLAGMIALQVLGPYAGVIASIAVSAACLTTAIALAAVFAEFLHKDILNDKINYTWSLVITLVISFFVSTLNFTGIAAFLQPILQVCYPALITLTVLNILHKQFHFQYIKVPVFVVFALSLIAYLV